MDTQFTETEDFYKTPYFCNRFVNLSLTLVVVLWNDPIDLGEIPDSFLNLLKVNEGHHVDLHGENRNMLCFASSS